MPTENPKISLYVPQAIYDRFKQFQEERQLSMSQAGIVILAEYFGLKQIIERTTKGFTVGGVTFDWVKSLEEQIIELKEEVEQLKFTNKLSKEQQIEQKNTTNEPLKKEYIKQVEPQQTIKIIDNQNSNLEEIGSKQENIEAVGMDVQDRPHELSVKVEAQTNDEEIWTPANLAKRLQVNPSVISRKKFKEGFTEWTREKDPEKIGWITLKSGQCKPERTASFEQNLIEQVEIKKQKENTPASNILIEETKSSQLNLLSEPLNKINPITSLLLTKRLGVHKDTCPHYKKKLSSEEFYEWSKQKDFEGIGWIPNLNGKGYVPGNELDDELLSKLQKWIEKNS